MMNREFAERCPVCGNPLAANAAVCNRCKNVINWQQIRQTRYAQAWGQYGQPQYPQSVQPQPPRKNTGAIVAIVILSAVLALVILGVCVVAFGDSKESAGGKNDRGRQDRMEEAEDGATAVSGMIENTESIQEEPAADGDTGELAEKTLIFYIVGSNLESDGGYVTMDIEEMLAADLSQEYKVVLQTGGTRTWHYDGMEDGMVQRFELTDDELVELENLGKLNMCNPENFTDFLKFVKEEYPAKEYALVMWDHGGGVPMGFGSDDIYPGYNLSVTEIADAIRAADIHFEAISFDACLMGTLETVYALKDCTDYMVASENVSWVSQYYTFIDYTDMLNNMQLVDVEATYYLEEIANPYVEDTNAIDTTASMSVYRMSQADDVYEAYVTYMEEVTDAVLNENRLNEYISAREAAEVALAQSVSNEAQGQSAEELINSTADTFDVVTFANLFKTHGSAHLISVVSNLILNRDTNSPKLNGLAAYAPYYYPVYTYEDGRTLFEDLAYDEDVVGFYDALVSFTGGAETASYDWYEDDILAAYGNPASDDIQICGMELIEKDGYYAWEVNSDFMVTAYTTLAIAKDENTLYLFGQDEYYVYDSDGDLCLARPDMWMHMFCDAGSSIIPYYGFAAYDLNENSRACEGAIIAYVNGNPAFLYTQTTLYADYSDTGILGYAYIDENFTIISDACELTDTDMVEFVYQTVDVNGSVEYEMISAPMTREEFVVGFYEIDLSQEDCYVYLMLEDIYGKEHETDMMPAY